MIKGYGLPWEKSFTTEYAKVLLSSQSQKQVIFLRSPGNFFAIFAVKSYF